MLRKFLFFIGILMTGLVSAGGSNSEFEPAEYILNHIADAHEWHIMTLGEGSDHEKHITVPLPIILYDGEFKMFLSTKLAHGHEYQGYKLDHGILKSVKGEKSASVFSLFTGDKNVFYDFSITKNVTTLLLSSVFIFLLFWSMAKSYKKNNLVPKGVAKFFEPVVLYIKEEVALPNIGVKHYERFLPFLLSLFFFIWLNNLLGLVPFFPGGANLTGNIAVTAVLGIITFFIVNFSGKKTYWKHIFAPHVPWYMLPIMIPVEIVGIFTKPFALIMRLFANISAGHIMILSIVSLVFIFKNIFLGPAAIALNLFVSILELLVALLQAYIFTILAALYIGMAVEEEHH